MLSGTCKKAELVEIIKVVVTKGTGESIEDPIEEVIQYWSKEGDFLFCGNVIESQHLSTQV